MSMTKRIIAVMVAVMMVMAMTVCTVSAAAVVDKFEVKEFSVLNSELAAGDVTVNVTLERIEGRNNDEVEVSVIAAIYSGTEMVDVAASTKTYIFNGTTQENTMELNIPQGTVAPELKVFLWDGDMITPLAKSSDEAEITGITIGGVEVADFDADVTSYNVTLPMGTSDEPAVYVEANGLTNADVTYADGVATIDTINGDYTINYTIPQGRILEIMYDGNTWTDANEVYSVIDRGSRVLRQPDSRLTADTSKTLREALGDDLDNFSDLVTVAWNDRTHMYFEAIPKEIEGLNYVPMSFANERSATRADWTVTTSADVRVYFFAWSNEISAGYNIVKNSIAENELSIISLGNGAVETPINTITPHRISDSLSAYRLCSYDIIVPDGQTSATATVRARNANYLPNMLMYEYINEEEEEVVAPLATITNATLERNSNATANYDMNRAIVQPSVYYDTGATNENGEKVYALGAEAGAAAATIFANYTTRMDADTINYGHYFPAEMIGARGDLWFTNYLIEGELAPELTFTINGDATLYFDTTDEFAAKSGAVRMDDYIGVYGGGHSYSAICNVRKTEAEANGKGDPFHGGRLFKLELKVPAGQSTATFTVPLAWYGSEDAPQQQYPFAYIK